MPAARFRRVKHKKAQLSSVDCDSDEGSTEDFDEFAVEIKQLNRKCFHDRIRLEEKLRVAFTHYLFFCCLVGSFLGSRVTYDPIPRIAAIHENMRQRYNEEELADISTVDEMQVYIQEFIVMSYEMASALVDANTKSSMELSRCFDSQVSDICRLKYWSLPDYDESLSSFVNMDDLVKDFLGPSNVDTSISCANNNDAAGCIDTSANSTHVKTDPSFKTYGLTPEDPIIMKSRLDYPQASVIPFSPLVWMSVATKVPCDGFGNEYNSDILGAGVCKADNPCKPYSSFTNSKPAPRTGRTQTIYITYEEDAFTCVDRDELATTFLDKSWSPWATFEDFHHGREMTAMDVQGVPVFYKFVSDISYLQAPIINGDVHACGNHPCDDASTPWDNCTDPLAHENHPMWDDRGGGYMDKCSHRRQWAKAYQATDVHDRRNTWITMNTTSFTIAVIVITPQMAGIADVVSLVATEFNLDQVGQITTSMQIRSVSDTSDAWKYWVMSTILFSFIFTLFSVDLRCYLPAEKRREKAANINKLFIVQVESAKYTHYLDLLCSFACIIQSSWAYYVEISPPYPIDELIKALRPGTTEEDYFKTVVNIIDYQNQILMTDYCAMFVTALLFMRFCLFLALHPRLAVLVDTLVYSADDLFHFMIYLAGIWLILGLFAHWQFGRELAEYATFGFTIWNQFLMFVGELGSAAEVKDSPIFQLYMGVFIFVTLIALMNFLLAIIMNAYTVVTDHLEEDKSENNIVKDVIDMMVNCFMSWKHNWPSTYVLWNHCLGKGQLPPTNTMTSRVKAIAAEELLYAVKDEQGFPGFKTLKHAQHFINWYCRKSGGNILERERKNHVPPGIYFVNGIDKVTPTIDDIETLEADLRRERALRFSLRSLEQSLAESAELADERVDATIQKTILKTQKSVAQMSPKNAANRGLRRDDDDKAVRDVEKEALESRTREAVDSATAIAEDLEDDGHYDGMPHEAPNRAKYEKSLAENVRLKDENDRLKAPSLTKYEKLLVENALLKVENDRLKVIQEAEPFISSHGHSPDNGARHKTDHEQKTENNPNLVTAIAAMQDEMMEMHVAILEELAELRELRESRGLAEKPELAGFKELRESRGQAEKPGAVKQTQIGLASSTTHKDAEWNAEHAIDEALNVLSTMSSNPQRR